MIDPDEGGGASQTTVAAAGSSTGTDIALRDYYHALRRADERFDDERDRRYQEVSIEREKALKIKEVADLAALQLAREIQTYKDEKANELRTQIERERGTYVTQSELRGAVDKIEATLKPLVDYISGQQGRVGGIGDTLNFTHIVVLLLIAGVGLYLGTR